VTGDYWSAYDANLDFDTGTTGADLFVQDDLEVEGTIFAHETLNLEGATADGNQVIIQVGADPGADVTLTLPTTTGTILHDSSTLDDDNVAFDDTDANFTATAIGPAVEELDDVNGSGPNAADGKVEWSQLVGVPAGFADGTDDGAGGGGDAIEIEDGDDAGTFTTVDTTARFSDDADINFTFADGGAGGPDTVTATVRADSIALGTDTTGNYVLSVTNGTGISGGDGGSEGAALTLSATLGTDIDSTEIQDGQVDQVDIDDTDTLAGNPAHGNSASWFGTTGLIFEGLTSDTNEGLLTSADITTTDKTWTLPDETGTILTSATTFAGDVGGTSGATTVNSVQNNAVTLTDDTVGNYVTSITNGTGITGGDGGSEGAALTIAATLGTSIDATEIDADAVGTSELDDGADTPLTGEYVRVDTVDQAGFEYRSTAEVLSDIGAESATSNDIDPDRLLGDAVDNNLLDHEIGGLEADVNAYTGLIAISGGATSEVDAKSELETQIADVSDFAEADGDVWTGVHDAGGATSFELPNSATPTTDATGEIALDTTITDHQPLLEYFNGTTNMTVIAIDRSELPALDNEIVKYDAATDKFVLEADQTAGGVAEDSIGTTELDDGADTPGSGEYIRVDTVDQAGIEYRSTAEVLSDIGAESATSNDIDPDRLLGDAVDNNLIDHEIGGLEADVNAYSGLVAISAGATSEVDAKSELEAQIADVADFAEADGDTYSGAHDFSGVTTMTLDQSAAPAPTAEGVIEWDTDEYIVVGDGAAGNAVFVPAENMSGDVTMTDAGVTTVAAASDSAAGKVELATAAETTTGTDATRAVTPDGLAGSDYGKRVVSLIVFDDSENNAIGDGAGDIWYRVPSVLAGYNLVDVEACVQTAGTTNTVDIQIHNVTQAADMLTTKITIDSAETDSTTAAAAPAIDAANDDVAAADQIRIDIDAIHTTPAKGLLVELTFQEP
jgi:hypothetical protein